LSSGCLRQIGQKDANSDEVKRLKNQYSGAILYTLSKKGERLSDYLQDEERHLFAILNLGGQSWNDVYARYDQIKAMLSFEFSDSLQKKKTHMCIHN
jgi:hypothetical protein